MCVELKRFYRLSNEMKKRSHETYTHIWNYEASIFCGNGLFHMKHTHTPHVQVHCAWKVHLCAMFVVHNISILPFRCTSLMHLYGAFNSTNIYFAAKIMRCLHSLPASFKLQNHLILYLLPLLNWNLFPLTHSLHYWWFNLL